MLVTPAYENRSRELLVEWKTSVHVPPHLHEAIEIVYVTSGTLELGIGVELHNMEEGDFAIVFPDVIHHYQVFSEGENRAIYVFVDGVAFPAYMNELQRLSPVKPVIEKSNLHADIVNAIEALSAKNDNNEMVMLAYVQMILAHVFSEMDMIDKSSISSEDIVYNAVEYVAKNFREEVTQDKMAKDLGIGKYALSRIFAKTFHCNFNKYVNGVRLNHATALLKNTNESITDLCFECGFESQRTFNRVFKDEYKMTPREYRDRMRKFVYVD